MRSISCLIAVCWSLCLMAQDPFNSARQGVGQSAQNVFNSGRTGNFNDYRQRLNDAYSRQLRENWADFNSYRGITPPDHDAPVVPPVQWDQGDNDGREQDQRIDIDRTIVPDRTPPAPPAPVAPVNVQPDSPTTDLDFSFFGTPMKVRIPTGQRFRFSGTGADSFADAWASLSGPEYAALVADCIRLRSQHRLSDWAYLKMLDALSHAYTSDNDTATMLMAYLFAQSGYSLRLGASGGHPVLLYASTHRIYNKTYFCMDGTFYYPYGDVQGTIKATGARFPKETSLSLWIPQVQKLDVRPSQDRKLKSQRFTDMDISVTVNRNIIDFYDTYPTSCISDNFLTRWAMYANTPMTEHTRDRLYPALRRYLGGLDKTEAVQRLLNWVQTAFVYEYDDRVWGGDRAFFPEETLYYPYADCEDRSILFTRLVRDIIGLDCLLVYYPGHLAAAVAFPADVPGDYVLYNNRRFVIADPTYIGAPLGRTMPQMDNTSASLILLNN